MKTKNIFRIYNNKAIVNCPSLFTKQNKFDFSFNNNNFQSYNTDFNPKDKRSFGYKEVKIDEHQGLVNNIFRNVANKYDLMNDVMSLGIHRLWKTEFVNMIGQIRPNTINISDSIDIKQTSSPMKILDVAGGTGDISLKILKKADEYSNRYLDSVYPVDITVVDINGSMLEEGRKRALSMNINENKLKFKESNAEDLSFIESDSIDLYTISFGIRNCTNRSKVLNEAYRVLKKKGGRFMCLEFSQVIIPGFNSLYNWYSENIIPELGGLFANDKESYKYLVESIRKFPSQEEFKAEIESEEFKFVRYTNFSGGICAVHSGLKI